MKWKGKFYKDLEAMEKACFPKVCQNCGRVYNSMHDFIGTTQDVSGKSGLWSVELTETTVGLMRNCVCKSTLMIVCSDRRDVSEVGKKRRLIFRRLMNSLVAMGINAENARERLIRWLRDGTDPIANMADKAGK